MNSLIQKNIKNLIIILVLVYTITVSTLSVVIFNITAYNLNSVAQVFTETIEKNLLIRDLREVTINLNKLVPNYFDGVVYLSKDKGVIFTEPQNLSANYSKTDIFKITLIKKIGNQYNNSTSDTEKIIFIYYCHKLFMLIAFIWIAGLFILVTVFNYYKKILVNRFEEGILINNAQTLMNVSKQVAHDIRSPLSALNIIMNTLTDVPEENRLLIRNSVQRINDIANDLLQKGKPPHQSQKYLDSNNAWQFSKVLNASSDSHRTTNLEYQHQEQTQDFLISTLIDSIVSEKRIQYREKINIVISIDLKNSFGLFVNAYPNKLARVISNLINNSVEAFPNHNGHILVSIFKTDNNKVCIQIKDNGMGIPKHVLTKFGEVGITHGKENSQSGSGLGIYHAVKTISEIGGTIHFQSTTAEDLLQNDDQKQTGTTISIEIPLTEPPIWFAHNLNLKPGQTFITVDDDISIHQIWKNRLESLTCYEHSIKVLSFTSAAEFRAFFNKNIESFLVNSKLNNMANLNLTDKNEYTSHATNNQHNAKKTDNGKGAGNFIFLIDYEFINQNDNGLKIITELRIQENALLVTSHSDELNIQTECEQQKIKILPKQLTGQIPIQIINETKSEITKHKYDWVLIDDDLLVHMTWKIISSEKKKNFIGFKSYAEFAEYKINIDPTSSIYIDSNLGNGIKGEVVARQIYTEGFQNIYIATGYDADQFKNLNYIKAVIGKDPPN